MENENEKNFDNLYEKLGGTYREGKGLSTYSLAEKDALIAIFRDIEYFSAIVNAK